MKIVGIYKYYSIFVILVAIKISFSPFSRRKLHWKKFGMKHFKMVKCSIGWCYVMRKTSWIHRLNFLEEHLIGTWRSDTYQWISPLMTLYLHMIWEDVGYWSVVWKSMSSFLLPWVLSSSLCQAMSFFFHHVPLTCCAALASARYGLKAL